MEHLIWTELHVSELPRNHYSTAYVAAPKAGNNWVDPSHIHCVVPTHFSHVIAVYHLIKLDEQTCKASAALALRGLDSIISIHLSLV